jgi:hypothetical protein
MARDWGIENLFSSRGKILCTPLGLFLRFGWYLASKKLTNAIRLCSFAHLSVGKHTRYSLGHCDTSFLVLVVYYVAQGCPLESESKSHGSAPVFNLVPYARY